MTHMEDMQALGTTTKHIYVNGLTDIRWVTSRANPPYSQRL